MQAVKDAFVLRVVVRDITVTIPPTPACPMLLPLLLLLLHLFLEEDGVPDPVDHAHHRRRPLLLPHRNCHVRPQLGPDGVNLARGHAATRAVALRRVHGQSDKADERAVNQGVATPNKNRYSYKTRYENAPRLHEPTKNGGHDKRPEHSETRQLCRFTNRHSTEGLQRHRYTNETLNLVATAVHELHNQFERLVSFKSQDFRVPLTGAGFAPRSTGIPPPPPQHQTRNGGAHTLHILIQTAQPRPRQSSSNGSDNMRCSNQATIQQ